MTLRKTLLSTLLLSFAIAGNVYAETAKEKFNSAVQYYEQRNYQAAFPIFKKLAEQEHAGAQYNLGKMYQIGRGVTVDNQQAIKWIQKAAEQGYADAQFTLGSMYEFGGSGINQDEHQAAKWYQKAAEQGHTGAQYSLALMYKYNKDYQQAVKWFQKAAEQGDAMAQSNLGFMYYHGQGVRQDKSKAKYYLGLACDNGNQTGCDNYRKLSGQGY